MVCSYSGSALSPGRFVLGASIAVEPRQLILDLLLRRAQRALPVTLLGVLGVRQQRREVLGAVGALAVLSPVPGRARRLEEPDPGVLDRARSPEGLERLPQLRHPDLRP